MNGLTHGSSLDSPYRHPDSPQGGSYRVVVQRFGDGEWVAVHAQNSLYGHNAQDACWTTLAHHWPVSVYSKDDWSTQWRQAREALAGNADRLRFAAEPGQYARVTDAATLTLGQMLLDATAHAARERVRAVEDLKAAREALRRAKGRADHCRYQAEDAIQAAVAAGVPDVDAKNAARKAVRKPRKTAGREARDA